MNSKSSNLSNTFAELKVNDKLNYLLKEEVSNQHFLEKLNNLSKNIDYVTKFSHNGLYYTNPLVHAIDIRNVSLVELLLKLGSASRGYEKYPGYPLYNVIDNINFIVVNKIGDDLSDLLSIMKLLVEYGARFDDYIVHVFWAKFNTIYNLVSEDEKKIIEELYSQSPFTYQKYEIYLNVYCVGFLENYKDKMLEKFSEKYPTKRNKSFILVNLFSFK